MTTAPKLTRAQQRQNAARRKQARKALDAYAAILGASMQFEDDETLLCDLLADCMHLMGREAVEGRMFMASEHYEAERRGEE
jgi:hypothetical protein